MLVAENNGTRVHAVDASKQDQYICPQCRQGVILKQGRIIIDHFAHQPHSDCTWAVGETLAHLRAKQLVFQSLKARGLRTELEYIIGDRRADVLVWLDSRPVAIELQHTNIGLEEIEMRAFDYAAKGIAQLWIPFIAVGSINTERYAVRLYEKWVHSFNDPAGMWIYDPSTESFWRVRLRQCAASAGHPTKKFRRLILTENSTIDDLTIVTRHRDAFDLPSYHWPSGLVASFTRQDATDYRLSTPANARDLHDGLADAKVGKLIDHDPRTK
jgi:hypothetical protein